MSDKTELIRTIAPAYGAGPVKVLTRGEIEALWGDGRITPIKDIPEDVTALCDVSGCAVVIYPSRNYSRLCKRYGGMYRKWVLGGKVNPLPFKFRRIDPSCMGMGSASTPPRPLSCGGVQGKI